jgi:GNAT superfamily N-acetyltransferase
MVEIKEVTTLSGLRRFRDFPDILYKGEPNYIPDLKGDELNMLRKDKNAAFEHSEARFFLAYKEGKIAGRVCALLNKAANERWNSKRMRITRIDFIDDPEVSAALFKAVETWAKEIGMTEVQGPLGFSDLDKEGLLVEGHELPGLSITIYNYPYYQKHFEANGYKKEADWVEYHLYPPAADSETYQKFQKLSRLVLKRHNLTLYELKKMSEAEPIVRQLFTLLSECYSDLYGVVPYTPKQADEYYKRFKPLLNPDYAKFVIDKDRNLVAFGLGAPSLSDALRKSKGRLFPIGLIEILKAIKSHKVLELYLVAVKPAYQKAGLPAVLMASIMESAVRNGVEFAESGPELENNEHVQALWKMFKTEQVRRRRCFIKEI